MAVPKKVALILAGAVAKGAFEAGVLKVIADAPFEVVRIVAASSGALNGAAFARGLRAREPRTAVEELLELWRTHAVWNQVFHPNFTQLIHLESLSDNDKVLGILRDNIAPVRVADPAKVNLRLTVAPLLGVAGTIGKNPSMTYEKMVEFSDEQFDSDEGLAAVFQAVLASSAFPGAFAPVSLPNLGPCVDGGMTNNTPVLYALEGELRKDIEAVIVISPVMERLAPDKEAPKGGALLGHFVDMLINERLYRDLHEAEQVNTRLAQLDAMALTDDQRTLVKNILGWQDAKQVEFVQIRPHAELPGGAFTGFLFSDEREAYIQAGIKRGTDVLRAKGWL